MSNPFLSIFLATCRPKNIIPFLDNLKKTAANPESFEVLIKLDEGADELINIIENYKKTSPFSIKYLASPKLDGYYSLDVGYNELLKRVHPETYFCWLLTDEIRMDTQNWDAILKKYVHFFPDDIFRIKLSIFQSKNYNNLFECLPCPDNYAVTTKRWLDITGGWGHFWGPDSWHQCIDYCLGMSKNQYHPYGIWRSFPVFDIKIVGQEAGEGITKSKELRERAIRIWYGWYQHSTHQAQENYHRLAQRLNAHIYACEKNIGGYLLNEDYNAKTVSLYDSNKRILLQKYSYSLPKFRLNLYLGYKKVSLWHLFPFIYSMRQSLMGFYHYAKEHTPVFLKRSVKKTIHTWKSVKQLSIIKDIKPRTRIINGLKFILSIRNIFQTPKSFDYRFDGRSFKRIE